jgi:hypothetical protein
MAALRESEARCHEALARVAEARAAEQVGVLSEDCNAMYTAICRSTHVSHVAIFKGKSCGS